MSPSPLASIFLEAAGGGRSTLEAVPDLEQILRDRVDRARAAWPGVEVDQARFLRYWAERVGDGPDPAAALAGTEIEDLYLACACSAGDPGAIAELDRRHLSQVPLYLARRRVSATFTDDVRQTLRERLLVAPAGGPPRIASYQGRGPLAGWIRVAALRAAANLRDAERRHEQGRAADDVPLRAPGPDPELDYMKTRYAAQFAEAFRRTLAALSSRERHVLRLHFLEETTTEAIGALYRVHRTTVLRWIAAARQTILEETRRLLGAQLAIGESELDSLMAMLQSRIDVSISQALKKTGA